MRVRCGTVQQRHTSRAMTPQDKPTDLISVRMPRDLREVIERAAEQEQRTFSGQIRFLICTAIEARSQPQHS